MKYISFPMFPCLAITSPAGQGQASLQFRDNQGATRLHGLMLKGVD